MRASVVRPQNESIGRGTTPAVEGGPTALRMILGARMRRLREACGISLEEAGEAIRGSHSKISRLELGRTGFRERDLVDLLALYGVTDERECAEFKRLAEQANTSGWWQSDTDWLPKWFDTYLGLEHAAQLIRCYEPRVVPELLQTPEYARALFVLAHPHEDEEAIERRVALRMRRQEILTRPDPPQMWLIVEEAALRRRIGGSQVWLAQLDHLLRVADAPNITVQVLADHVGGPAVSDGAFTMLRFAESDLPDIVYLQQLTGALYLDKDADLAAYRAVANLLSVHAAPPEYTRDLIAALREREPQIVELPSGSA
ncbi:helix-turn-helix transcriptional regulator [Nocardia implantans]|uniref:Helix-turn-helix transcriptional regulator n=1 Tax=Nocardia implantans TaxID=3108168 RepID=A0ABU6ARG5_9NOCA|nr:MULTISPECIES: helix-turn-helix transcriptional regulator [unclassified Nocardia]MEA3528199.1 helix-turn-helix transcriptional regulator [Nocardia sp. CDC192]MEB3510051.1 helix-turn-helix transcriptional regulator [Nocardia sp. CDC186]